MGFIIFLAVAVIVGVMFFFTKKSKNPDSKPGSLNLFPDEKGGKMSTKDSAFLASMRAEAGLNDQNKPEVLDNKVLCHHCESYVDIDENELCPNCGATLYEEIQAEKRRRAMVEVERLRLEAEVEREREKTERTERALELGKAAMIATVAPISGTKKLRNTLKK